MTSDAGLPLPALCRAPNVARSGVQGHWHDWSSVHANPVRCQDSLVAPHPCFMALGNTPPARADAHQDWLQQGASDDQLLGIRQYLPQERAFGSKCFQAMAEETLG